MLRRLLGLVLALALLDPLGPFAAARASRHECTDHVCACVRAAQSNHCHGAEREGPGMQASCNHDGAAGSPRSVTPALPTLEPLLEASLVQQGLEPSPSDARLPGFTRIDSPPPRSL